MGYENADLESLAEKLDASPDYRVLRNFVPRQRYNARGTATVVTAAAIDVETTGLSSAADAVIQLCIVPFTYDPDSGTIFEVETCVSYYEDPGRPIPPDITALTGIADTDVAGKRIDDGAISELLAPVSLVIAHNARFDRPFVERRLPLFREKHWACSINEVPWKSAGLPSSALEYLLIKHCGRFYSSHRADSDALALIHLLASPLSDGRLPMRLLLESARQRTALIWAEGAPIEFKDLLKARQYRWNNGTDGRPKAWSRELPTAEQERELAWLSENVYGGRRPNLRVDVRDARTRYSERS